MARKKVVKQPELTVKQLCEKWIGKKVKVKNTTYGSRCGVVVGRSIYGTAVIKFGVDHNGIPFQQEWSWDRLEETK